MAKILLWGGVLIAGVVILILIFNFVKEEARPLVMSPQKLALIERGELMDEDWVIVTISDGYYHLPGCENISGAVEKMIYSAARERELRPCPYCIGE